MKIFTKILGIVAIGAVIAAGLIACKSTPIELDEETLAAMENASWVVKPLVHSPFGFMLDEFKYDETDGAYFGRLSVKQGMELRKEYALTAPEFPDTYWYVSTVPILGNKGSLGVYKSTTIDEETFNRNNDTWLSASWKAKALPGEPSLNGLEEVRNFGGEFSYVLSFLQGGYSVKDGTWYECTSPDVPGITYYWYRVMPTGGAINIGSTKVYKNKQ